MFGKVNILSKFQLPSSSGLGEMMFGRFGGKGLLYQVPGEAGSSPHGPQRVDLALTLFTFS